MRTRLEGYRKRYAWGVLVLALAFWACGSDGNLGVILPPVNTATPLPTLTPPPERRAVPTATATPRALSQRAGGSSRAAANGAGETDRA